jgi:hypothetical protein
MEHNGLDDPGPDHQNAADERNRTQASRDAAGDKNDTRKHERNRNDPEELRVFDGSVAF